MVRDMIVVGAPAGSVAALETLVGSLPRDLPAAVFIVMHRAPTDAARSLPDVLTRAGALEARYPADGETIQAGHIYVAPPERHLVIEGEQVRLTPGSSDNPHRPAIDPLFRTAARFGRRRVIGVILSGPTDGDGRSGLGAVKRAGGLAVLEEGIGEPAAAGTLDADYLRPLAEIGPLLFQLASGFDAPPVVNPFSEKGATDTFVATDGETLSAFHCPVCGGAMGETDGTEGLRFRCRTGRHAFSGEALLSALADAGASALGTALRAFDESQTLARRLADRARQVGAAGQDAAPVAGFEEQARQAKARAERVRQALITPDKERSDAG